jgi:hypothetical protein
MNPEGERMGKITRAMERVRRERSETGDSTPLPPPEGSPEPSGDLEMHREMALLYQHIDSLLRGSPRKVIQFIAAREGEGTSTIVREFAKTSATILGKSVFLFDADLQNSLSGPAGGETPDPPAAGERTADAHPNPRERHPRNRRRTHGRRERAETVRETGGGTGEGNPGKGETALVPREGGQSTAVCLIPQDFAFIQKQFYSPQIDGFWENLRQKFELVLIDSPPLSVSPDGIAISSRVDGVVLVLEAEKTRWPVVENLKDQILKSGGNLLGIVFNKRRFYIPESIYRRI